MVNFHSFEVDEGGIPMMPIVTVNSLVSKEEDQKPVEGYYYSNKRADWEFDENILVVPLLNYEAFAIQVTWREGSSSRQVSGRLAVFIVGEALRAKPNFMFPIVANNLDSVVTVHFNMTSRVLEHPYSHNLLVVKACIGTVESVEATNGKTILAKETKRENLDEEAIDLGDLRTAETVSVKIRLKGDKTIGRPVAKIGLLQFDDLHSTVQEIMRYDPVVNVSDSIASWQTVPEKALKGKFGVHRIVYFDKDITALNFKRVCGFSLSIFTT